MEFNLRKRESVEYFLQIFVDAWLETIEDTSLKRDVIRNGYVAGGCIPSLFYQEPPNDWDLYFTDSSTARWLVNEMYRQKQVVKRNDSGYAYELRNGIHIVEGYQTGTTAEEGVNAFDFRHCQGYYRLNTRTLYVNHNTYSDIENKRLVYNVGCPYPLKSIMRIGKYIQRGWTIEPETYVRIFEDIRDLDLHDVQVWDEQLDGLYS